MKMLTLISALVIVTSGIYILSIAAVVCFFLFYTEVSCIFLSGSHKQNTGHRSQAQVLTVLITNWDKQFALYLKLYLRLLFRLKDTVSIVFFHGTVTCTLTWMSVGSK